MSVPARMERSRDSRHSLAPPPQPAQGSSSGPAAALPPPPPPLRPDEPQRGRPCPCPPGRLPTLSLLGLALLQLVLGSALVALSFATLWLSSAGGMKNSTSAWAGSWAMLCGILALIRYKRSETILVCPSVFNGENPHLSLQVVQNRLLVLLSLTCVALSLTGFTLGRQGIEFLSRVPRCDLMDKENKICFCCQESITKCTEVEAVLKLYHVKSCNSAHLLLKKILLGLCVLNALITTVCLTEVALYCGQILVSRRSSPGELQTEDQDRSTDPDGFVPPVPSPLYVITYNSGPPQTGHRTPLSDGLSLSNVHARQIYSEEVFLPVGSPPPYEEEESLNASEQGGAQQRNVMNCVDLAEEGEDQDSKAKEISESSSRTTSYSSNESYMSAAVIRIDFACLSDLQINSAFITADEDESWRSCEKSTP